MRAVVLGGTGAIGGATAIRLAAGGWDVDVTGRDATRMPSELVTAGVRFHGIDRGDVEATQRLVGAGTDLLVDMIAYSAADVKGLLPMMRDADSVVLVSSRAVYADSHGRHINGDEPPRFEGPLCEDGPTVPPAGEEIDPFSREGYAPSKVAAEQTALDSGLPVTVIRPSKVHGRWARNPRTRVFVERMLRDDRTIRLAQRGSSVDHLTAATNTSALIEAVAYAPGARILNSADPDTPTALEIVTAIALELGWDGELELLNPGAQGGEHPWLSTHPIVLDTTAAVRLGYQPAGLAVDLLREEVRWLADAPRPPDSRSRS